MKFSCVIVLFVVVLAPKAARELKQSRNSLTDLLSVVTGTGQIFRADSTGTYGDSADDKASYAAVGSAFITGDSESVATLALNGISLDRFFPNGKPSSQVYAAGVQAASGDSNNKDGVVSAGLQALLGISDDNTAIAGQESSITVVADGPGVVNAIDAQTGLAGTNFGSAAFRSNVTAQDTGANPQVTIISDGAAASREDTSLSSSTLCATANNDFDCLN
eukprot:TRINITY_DN157_c0_g1_i11.p2 TRINITY_DN157_c0_g1~~TRINITY_DN157_c0_g1_i11.p2  ORF type:complete len:220 (-),score=34.47 TRINITY_DN157_c0_g1_i11:404-1063(-)